MSRVVEVRTWRVTAPLHTAFVTSLRRTETVDSVLVRLVDEDGVTGWGEAPAVWRVTGESQASAEACVDGPLRDVVLGRHLDELPSLAAAVAGAVAANHGAKSAVDTAMHDLAARRAGVPLAALLGEASQVGPVALSVRTDVTLAADASPGDAVARVEEGFTVLKLKAGADPDDAARVAQVRRAVGPHVGLRVDANQAWDAATAVRVVTGWEDAGVGLELVEQPVPAWDVAGMAWVRARVATPVLADESVFDVHDLDRVAREGAADLVNVKLAKCGGVAPALALLRRAAEHGLGALVGSMMETHVGVAAAASVAAAAAPGLVHDLDAAWWLRTSPVVGGMAYDGPTVALSARPGLDVERMGP